MYIPLCVFYKDIYVYKHKYAQVLFVSLYSACIFCEMYV